jgi:hypothetical protein
MRWTLAKTLDHACVPSRLSLFYYLSLSHPSLLLPPTLFCVRFSFRVQYQRFSLPCFQFIALASIILPRSRSTFPVPIPCRLHFQSFVYHLALSPRSITSFRSRHPNNMSPIMTFLVSGLPLLFGVMSPLSCFCLGAAASPFLGFLAMSPVPFMASCFSVRRRTSWLLPPCGFEDPRKTSLPSRRYDDIASRLWV